MTSRSSTHLSASYCALKELTVDMTCWSLDGPDSVGTYRATQGPHICSWLGGFSNESASLSERSIRKAEAKDPTTLPGTKPVTPIATSGPYTYAADLYEHFLLIRDALD